MSEVAITSKLTLKDIGCNGRAAAGLPNMGDRIALARFYGVAVGVKTKEDSRTGDVHSALKGNFRAIVVQDGVATKGQTFSSGMLYLPGGIHELIEAPLMAADLAGEEGEVKFAVDVFAYRAGNAAGFSYGANIVGEPVQNDPMAEMEAMLEKVKPLALSAPATPAEPTTASEPEAKETAKK